MFSTHCSPVNNSVDSTEKHDYDAEYNDGDVDTALKLGLCDGLVVEHGWECEGDWRAGEGAEDTQELADLVVDDHGDDHREEH